MTTPRNPKYLAAVFAAAAAIASMQTHPGAAAIVPPVIQERPRTDAPPPARDKRDRKRRKPLKHAKRQRQRQRQKQVVPRAVSGPAVRTIDMRHDKFLNSSARGGRKLKWCAEHPGKPFPHEWTAETAERPKPIKVQPRRREASTYRGAGDHAGRMAIRREKQRASPPSRFSWLTRYRPHQGKRECARRLRQQAKAGA